MCIKAIKNFDFEAAKDNLHETIKYLDAGKVLGVLGGAMEELHPKKIVAKVKDTLSDEDLRIKVDDKLHLVGDLLTWPVSMVSSFLN